MLVLNYDSLFLEVEAKNKLLSEDTLADGKGLYQNETFTVTAGKDKYKRRIGEFTLAPYTGCCGIVISTNTWIERAEQGTGYARRLQTIKEDLAKRLGYTKMQATVEATNIKEVASLIKSGWKVIDQFKNKRTEHELFVFSKELKT